MLFTWLEQRKGRGLTSSDQIYTHTHIHIYIYIYIYIYIHTYIFQINIEIQFGTHLVHCSLFLNGCACSENKYNNLQRMQWPEIPTGKLTQTDAHKVMLTQNSWLCFWPCYELLYHRIFEYPLEIQTAIPKTLASADLDPCRITSLGGNATALCFPQHPIDPRDHYSKNTQQ